MATDAAYFEAALPEPSRALGVALRPFSLGHKFILNRCGCAFATGGDVSFADLILGVSVCSRDYQSALRFLNPGWRERWQLRLWGWRAWFAVKCGYDLRQAAIDFRAYIEAASQMPNFMVEDKDGEKRLRAPIDIVLKVSLQSDLGYSPEEAMELPYGQALHEYVVAAARKGQVELVDDDWQDTYDSLQISPQAEIDRMVDLHRRLTTRN